MKTVMKDSWIFWIETYYWEFINSLQKLFLIITEIKFSVVFKHFSVTSYSLPFINAIYKLIKSELPISYGETYNECALLEY